MAITTENQQELIFEDDAWHLINPFDNPTMAMTCRNKSNTSVSVYCTDDHSLSEENVEDYLRRNNIDPPEIGGIFYEVSSHDGQFMFVRCNEGIGKVAVRVFGTMDPSEDISVLAQVLNETTIILDNHLKTVSGNPHQVTKHEVGLGEIPNAITNDVDDPNWTVSTDGHVLPTLNALRTVRDYAQAHINTFSGNPHQVTKAEVGLGLVENYAPATLAQAIDVTNNTVYLTPFSANELIKDIVVIANSMKPQMVIQGRTANRPSGWNMNDITRPTALMGKTATRQMKIFAGLQVSYAYRGLCRISKVLPMDMTCNFGDTIENGCHYVFVTLDTKGNFTGWGATPAQPCTQANIDAYDGDYYNYATCQMQHVNGTELFRVYIGRVFFSDNNIIDLQSVPLGDEAIIPVLDTIPLGKSALLSNPFVAPVETTALVEVNGRWGETRWNDQTGVIASPRPGFEFDQIVVQVGLVGYVTKGSSAGSAFGSEFLTITSPIRMAVKVRRPH